MAFPKYILETTHHAKSGLFTINNGPGCKPYNISAPKSIAVEAEPGIPKVNNGIIDPEVAALLEASGATNPGICPFPNFSGVFEIFFSSEYVRSEVIVVHVAGCTPTTNAHIGLREREYLGTA